MFRVLAILAACCAVTAAQAQTTQRYYNANGQQTGHAEHVAGQDRFYNSNGQQTGHSEHVAGQTRYYDANGHQIGHSEP